MNGPGDPDAPHGVSLAEHAAISAAIAEGARPAAEILADHGLDDARWLAATTTWMTRLADEARRTPTTPTIAHAYSEAFARAQDAIAPRPPLDASAWAALVREIQRDGGPARALARRGLSLADYLRLARHMARTLPADAAESAAFFAAYGGAPG